MEGRRPLLRFWSGCIADQSPRRFASGEGKLVHYVVIECVVKGVDECNGDFSPSDGSAMGLCKIFLGLFRLESVVAGLVK